MYLKFSKRPHSAMRDAMALLAEINWSSDTPFLCSVTFLVKAYLQSRRLQRSTLTAGLQGDK